MSNGALTRALAARAVAAVINRGQTLDAALDAVIASGTQGRPPLPDRDRAQVRALAFGAVRGHHRHRALLRILLNKPLKDADHTLEALLSVGLFQMADSGQPDHAAVSATVEASRVLGAGRAAGLVNATLRRYQRESAVLLEQLRADPAAWYSQPEWLIRQLKEDFPAQWAEIAAAGQQRAPLWIRVNRNRSSVAHYAALLEKELGLPATTLDGFPDALRLDMAVPVQRLPGFTEGMVTVQDAASQLAAPLLAPQAGMRVLDACAAPGGKTTHLLEVAGGELDMTAVDLSPERLARVADNLKRLGMTATLVAGDATNPAAWWDGRPYDRILVDAPCTATGVLRRHPDIALLRRQADIKGFVERQHLLLDRLWPLLAPGGKLLYSTCSLLRAENQAVIEAFVARTPAMLEPATPPPGLQLLPGSRDTDGFYYALMAPVHRAG